MGKEILSTEAFVADFQVNYFSDGIIWEYFFRYPCTVEATAIDTVNFQTPPDVCRYMVEMIPTQCITVLEPTPGAGNLSRAISAAGFSTIVPNRFEDVDWDVRPDCVVMNPPFTPMRTGYRILDACMAGSDNVIALMPWLTVINSQRRAKVIGDYGLISITHLPRHIFPGSRVQCCILQMQKGFIGTTQFRMY